MVAIFILKCTPKKHALVMNSPKDPDIKMKATPSEKIVVSDLRSETKGSRLESGC